MMTDLQTPTKFLQGPGNCVGKLLVTAKEILVLRTLPQYPYRNISQSGPLPAGTIFMVTKHTKPLVCYQHAVPVLERDNLTQGKDYAGISYCTEMMIGDMYVYMFDDQWLFAFLDKMVVYLEE